jgi:outer membrane protein assembly factor BamE (lipoprotein component of BamABCDE complex)
MIRKSIPLLTTIALLSVGACTSAGQHAEDVQSGLQGDRLTVGKVQREIRVGMSGAQVVEALGSPNVVSTDEQRREVWVYDKIATDQVYSTSYGGVSALILGGVLVGPGVVGGGVGPSGGYSAGAQSKSQRTLTVIIKFDEMGKVRDFAYHSSRF